MAGPDYTILGSVKDSSGTPIGNVKIQAMDSDQQWFEDRNDDILGSTWVKADGSFKIPFSGAQFQEGWLEGNPDIYLMVRNAPGEVVHTTEIRRGVKPADTKNLTFDIVLDSLEKKIPEPEDPYSHSIERLMAAYRTLEGAAVIAPADFARVFELISKTVSTWTIYTREPAWRAIGYDGPQVPRYPWKEKHSHKLQWEE